MPLLAELLNSFDSLYMTDPFLYFFVVVFIYIYLFFFFACHANPFYPEQQLIAFLKIRASMCKLFEATLFKFNDSFLPLVSD